MQDADFDAILADVESKATDAFGCISLLKTYTENIGVHHFIVSRLHSLKYDDLEFFIPQFMQLLVSYPTESMALEEFLLYYCERYPHFSLIVFWHLQAYIYELRNDADSYSFQVVRRFVSKLQTILFNPNIPHLDQNVFRENLKPALVLCGAMAASFGVRGFDRHSLCLIKSQARQQKSFVFKLANFQKTLTRNLTLKNKRLSSDANSSIKSDGETVVNKITAKSHDADRHELQRSNSLPRIPSKARQSLSISHSDDSEMNSTDDEIEHRDSSASRKESYESSSSYHSRQNLMKLESDLKINTFIKSKKSTKSPVSQEVNPISLENEAVSKIRSQFSDNVSSRSLPDLSQRISSEERPYLFPVDSESSFSVVSNSDRFSGDPPISNYGNTSIMTMEEMTKALQSIYAKKENDFIMALQNISLRLAQLPKEARLSALRAELSIINENLLPAEIDIPQLLPITSKKNKKYHKILRISVNEACVLNSAERVPFLLLIEYLSDEFDFNPISENNRTLLLAANSRDGTKTEMSPIFGASGKLGTNQNNLFQEDFKTADNASEVSSLHEADLSEISLMTRNDLGTNLDKLKVLDAERSVNQSHVNPERVPNIEPSRVSEAAGNNLADQMRIASVMLQQLESSNRSTSDQSLAIKNRIVESMIALQDRFESINYTNLAHLNGAEGSAGERKLENDFKLSEDWATKKARIRKTSVYGHLRNWELCSVIAKNGDDLPQEAFACQLITMISSIWRNAGVPTWTKRMRILITSASTGLVETITNAMSIHSIKKSLTELSIANGENVKGTIFTLKDYFEKKYGSPNSVRYVRAQDCFARSLASYSILCYVLQIKDRHNGNIMLDDEGHIIHIDFGFLLSNSPGSMGFEAAPFKLTAEYIDVLGGLESKHYQDFKDICKQSFKAIRKEHEQIVTMVELMQKESNLPCFRSGESTSNLLKQRLQLALADDECDAFVENNLIAKSLGSMYTRLYDQFQMLTQGIYS
uniref:1-phosphatidylinositol 4-kinase n=1 Tax=Meyerozyma guilliermondii TaxID=4929 RepID=C5HU35_PICGM|nr:pik1 [Meyerozyma guilliermondii]